jgi:hypothetical protein
MSTRRAKLYATAPDARPLGRQAKADDVALVGPPVNHAEVPDPQLEQAGELPGLSNAGTRPDEEPRQRGQEALDGWPRVD